MNRNPSVLIRVSPTLCSKSIGLVRRVTCINVTILENNRGISKYKIDRAIYVTFPIELPLGMDIEGLGTLPSYTCKIPRDQTLNEGPRLVDLLLWQCSL